MDEKHIVTAIISFIGILGIIYIWLWLYRSYRVDKFRQDMFILRDRFFDEALKGDLGFDAEAYGIVRGAMNGYIRYGHRINLWNTFLFVRLTRNDTFDTYYSLSARIERATENLSPQQAHIVNTYIFRMHMLIIEQLFLGTPELLPITLSVIGYCISYAIIKFGI